MPEERYLTVAEAASRLGVAIDTVRRWIRSGELRAAKPGGDKAGYRIPESAVAARMQPV